MKKILLLAIITVLPSCLFAGTFTSLASGAWNAGTSWTAVADADGIPDADDNITIQAAHNITVTGTGHSCKNLTVDGTLTLNSACNLTVWGNYTLNGSETGSNGSLTLKSAAGTISGLGSFGPQVRYSIVAANYTISAGVVILKTVQCSAGNGSIINNGYVKFAKIYGNAETWINNTGATLEFGSFDISLWFVNLDASAVNNTVIYSNTPTSVNMIQPMGGIYHNLTVTGVASQKRLTGDIQVNGNLSINSSGVLNTQGFNVSVKGDFNKVGGTITFTGTSNFTFNGTVAQNLFTGASGPAFINLTVNNPTSVTFATATYTVSGVFAVQQGTANVGINKFTLLSNVTSTAVIGTSNGTINGTMTFQRFIDARAAGYSDMSCGVQGQTVAEWDDDLLLVYTYAPPSAYPSIFGYDETAWDYVPVTTSTQTLDPGVGFEVYLDSDGTQTTFNATTMDHIGTPNMGDVDMSGYLTFNNDGWNLIGNPYHANISYDILSAATLDIASDGMYYDETIEDFAIISGGFGELIAPMQGFWVNVTGPAPSLVFTEATKTTSTSSTFRHASNVMFTLRLKSLGQTKYTSGTNFRFSDAPEAVVKGGSLPFHKVPVPEAPVLCSKSAAGKDLKLNLLNTNENTLTVPLKFTVGLSGIYIIESQNAEMANVEGYSCISLFDSKLNRTVDIANENYQFYAEEGEANNRFTLLLSKSGNCQSASTDAISSDEVDINRIGENALVKLNFDKETTVSIVMTDLLGQKLIPAQTLTTAAQNVYLPIPAGFSGIFLVNVSYDGKTKTNKLYK